MTEYRAVGNRTVPTQESSAQASLPLIELDYEQSLRFIDGVVRISATIRQTTTTAAVALIGLSIQNKSPELAIAAVILGVTLGFMDGYHGWLYKESLRRVTQMENIFRQAKAAQFRPDDDAVTDRLADLIDDFKVGALSQLPQFTPRNLLDARPTIMYTIYPLTIVGGILAATVA
jgi:hypothetical protein